MAAGEPVDEIFVLRRGLRAPQCARAGPEVTLPLLFLLQWDDEGNDRRPALDPFDTFGSEERTLRPAPEVGPGRRAGGSRYRPAGRRSPTSAAAGRVHADRLDVRLPHVPRPTRPEAPPAARTRRAVSRSQRALRLGVRVWVA